MKKLLATLFQLSPFLFAFSLSAAIPQHWTVETSRVQPAQFEAYHGETIEFAAAMQTYGKPLAITNDLIGIYWQTNGMGSAYWTAPAVISNNVMIARWEPEMDVGANVYSCFIGAPGEIYRAAFQLRLRPSPGAEPSELPLPVKTLDFAQVTVLNAPYYSKSETDAKIIDIRNTVNNLADNVSTWSSYWSGDDVRVTVTNYDSAVNLPSLYLEYKLSNGTFRTVWDERTRWDINDRRMAAVESAVEGKADRAWGYYDSHTGGWAPDGYTWLSSPKIAISGGMAYQKHVTSEGAVWVLESNGLIAESGGVMSNGFFRISDDEGNPLFEIVKGDKRTVGATAGSCEPLAGYAITHLQIGYAVESADHPKIYVTRSLTPVDWKNEEDADCPATVNWSGSSGNWTAVVAGKVAEAQLFVKAEYEVGGNTYIKQSAPVSVQKLVLGGQEYRVGTATISGHTVLTLTLGP